MPRKNALIFGIGGQDGYYMSWALVRRGFNVTGVLLPADMAAETIPHLPLTHLSLIQGSICDGELVREMIKREQPEMVFNFAGTSFIPASWTNLEEVCHVNGSIVGQILNIIRLESPETRFFQAGSSEMFGHEPVLSPQNEQTPYKPDNPYGSAKVLAAHLVSNFRSRYGIFACVGILYNHESPWRPGHFLTRKISLAAASIKKGKTKSVVLGDLNAVRDWSYAGDIVEGMLLMMNQNHPKDYVLASGHIHSVTNVLDVAFDHVGISWTDHVISEPSLKRPDEDKPLLGNSSLARKELGWRPTMKFEQLIRKMVEADLERLSH